jgi:hypothetical protein
VIHLGFLLAALGLSLEVPALTLAALAMPFLDLWLIRRRYRLAIRALNLAE